MLSVGGGTDAYQRLNNIYFLPQTKLCILYSETDVTSVWRGTGGMKDERSMAEDGAVWKRFVQGHPIWDCGVGQYT